MVPAAAAMGPACLPTSSVSSRAPVTMSRLPRSFGPISPACQDGAGRQGVPSPGPRRDGGQPPPPRTKEYITVILPPAEALSRLVPGLTAAAVACGPWQGLRAEGEPDMPQSFEGNGGEAVHAETRSAQSAAIAAINHGSAAAVFALSLNGEGVHAEGNGPAAGVAAFSRGSGAGVSSPRASPAGSAVRRRAREAPRPSTGSPSAMAQASSPRATAADPPPSWTVTSSSTAASRVLSRP
jgi:hypothetical protein